MPATGVAVGVAVGAVISSVPEGLIHMIHQSFGVGLTCGRRRVVCDHSSERVSTLQEECAGLALKPWCHSISTIHPLLYPNGKAMAMLFGHR